MKNLRLITLSLAFCLFSIASIAQSFNDYGTFTGTMADGKDIVLELNANGVASIIIDGNSDNVVEFRYVPASSNIIKFKAFSNVSTVGDVVVQPIFRRGLFEPINATQWRLQLNGFGQAEPTQFDSNEIILDYTPN